MERQENVDNHDGELSSAVGKYRFKKYSTMLANILIEKLSSGRGFAREAIAYRV